MKTECSQCRKKINSEESVTIDGEIFCRECLYGDSEPLHLYSIGTVRNNQKRSSFRFGVKNRAALSEIVLLESQKRFMYRLEEEKYLTIIYWLHESKEVKSVFRRGLDGKKVGVFASRTPDRLSRLAIQDVELVRIEGTTLYVKNLDAIDGSPVLDIKLSRKGR